MKHHLVSSMVVMRNLGYHLLHNPGDGEFSDHMIIDIESKYANVFLWR